MNQIEKIKRMEQNMDEVSETLKMLDEALEKYIDVQTQLQELNEYYGSAEWRKDFEDDSIGMMPPDLKRGVLSEDGAYNLLMENRRLLDRMTEVIGNCGRNGLENRTE